MFKSSAAPPISTSLDSLKVKVSEKDEESERGRFFSSMLTSQSSYLTLSIPWTSPVTHSIMYWIIYSFIHF